MTKILDKRVSEIEVLRFPLVLLVLFIHMIPAAIYPFDLSWKVGSAYIFVSEIISHHIGRVAVPAFFLFSGYFFFLKLQNLNVRIYADQLRMRLRTLFIPYVLWNVLFVLVVLLKNFIFGKMGMMEDDMYAHIKGASYYNILWGGPFLYPLWYLRDLICMVVLSPLFFLLFKYTKWIGLLAIIMSYLLIWESNIDGLSTTAFMYFGVGAFMGMYKFDLMILGVGYKFWKLLIAISLVTVATYFSGTPYYEYWIRLFIPSGVIAILCAGSVLVKTRGLNQSLMRLSSPVFFIYAIHSIYIINWIKGAFAKLPVQNSDWGKLLGYFTVPIICSLVCLCLYGLMKKFLPNILSVLIGGRIIVQSVKK